jgi:hypothetical protein
MVNDRFPPRIPYGFGKVDATKCGAFAANHPHQSKIYTESKESNFLQIFGELISMQTLAIYRRLLVRGSTARDQARRL